MHVSFFMQDRGLDRNVAVLAGAIVPMGWVIGCPLLGYISDRLGRRKPVLVGGSVVMILCFLQLFFFWPIIPAWLTMLFFGIASGAAMIPYTMIKEANPETVKGSATGGINFMTFGITSCIAPVSAFWFGKSFSGAGGSESHFQSCGIFLIVVIVVALVVSFVIKETGTKKQVQHTQNSMPK